MAAPGLLRGVGVLLLSACMLLALLLVLAELNAVELPGCGTASDCTRAAASRWGKLPGTQWPLSFVGFAYFQALLAAYLYRGGRLPALLRAVVACGAAASAMLTIVMFAEDYVCGYCLAIHGLNVLFAIGYEANQRLTRRLAPSAPSARATCFWFAATFALAAVLLAIVDRQARLAVQQATADKLQKALVQATADGRQGVPSAETFAPGRYVLGPPSAPVHVVVVSDYECPSCRAIDAQLRAMIAGRDDVSISARHFPLCADCNEHIDKTTHANACRAALAAEAAGRLGGAEAFWRTHDWLFQHGGEFSDDQLESYVVELNLAPKGFLETMQSDETLAVIRADAADADAAGLKFTPLVFINGVAIQVDH
jgi:protein-disulfide isomerase/uncharacterized membrane protein